MKHFLSTLTVCLMVSGSLAQDDFKPHNEIGLNVTTFFTNFLGTSDNSDVNPMAFDFIYNRVGEKSVFRSGIGFGYADANNKPPGAFEKTNTRIFNFSARIGVEKRIPIYKERWVLAVGGDITGFNEWTRFTTTSNFDKTININQTTGGGAVGIIGIQLNINNRVALRTESGLQFVYAENEIKSKSDNFPDFDTDDKVTSASLSFLSPNAIILLIRL